MPKNKDQKLEKYIFFLLQKGYNVIINEEIYKNNSFDSTFNKIIVSNDIEYNDLYETINTVDACEIHIYDKTIPFNPIGNIQYTITQPFDQSVYSVKKEYVIYDFTHELMSIFEEVDKLDNMGIFKDYAL